MSTGTKIGAVFGAILGGIVGWFVSGGNPMGAFQGAMLGMSLLGGIGGYIDPLSPDIDGLGASDTNKLTYTTSDEGLLIPDALGTVKITGNFVWFDADSNRSEEVTESGDGGGGKGMGTADTTAVTGTKYYLTFIQVFCVGPVENVYAIYEGDKCVWKGDAARTGGGTTTISVGGIGSIEFYFGTTDQPAPSLTTSEESPAYRGQCFAYFQDCCIGDYNRVPVYSFVMRKGQEQEMEASTLWVGEDAIDINPAHAFYHICKNQCKISADYLDLTSFNAVAQTLYNEDFGIGIYLDKYTSAKSYLESILSHMDGIARWGINGKLHLKLIRQDEEVANIPVISQEDMLEPITFNRRSWLELINEVKVQYSERFLAECETE